MNTKIKSIVIAAVVVLALAIGAFIYFTPPAAAPAPGSDSAGGNVPAATGTPAAAPTDTSSSSAPAPKPPAQSGITMADVAAHSGGSDCWTVIRGNVYNLTDWISKHPGGRQAILEPCGKDGTAQFVGQHGGSPQQESILAAFKIGVLAK